MGPLTGPQLTLPAASNCNHSYLSWEPFQLWGPSLEYNSLTSRWRLQAGCRPHQVASCAGLKNLLRGGFLAIGATFLGCFLIFTLPDWTAAQLNFQMPYWFYEREVSCKSMPPHLSLRPLH